MCVGFYQILLVASGICGLLACDTCGLWHVARMYSCQVAPVDPYPLLGLSYLILTLWTLWVAFRDVPKHYYILHLQVGRIHSTSRDDEREAE